MKLENMKCKNCKHYAPTEHRCPMMHYVGVTDDDSCADFSENVFNTIADELKELHSRKNADYGNAFGDSFREFGTITAVIRLNDKMNRLKSLVRNQVAEVKDESIIDTLMDMAAYSIMTIEQIKNL